MPKKLNSFCLNVIALLAIVLMSACAIKVAPQGGAKDEIPPKIIETTPKNYSVNFSGREFKLRFDELVELKEVTKQLIVSPLLKNAPDFKIHGKEIIVDLSDTLKPNTTYTFNFGNSIVDVHEGNVLENYQFVFATGNHLDSLTIAGNVTFADNLKTEKGIAVMLYSDKDDSCIYKRMPDYYTTTNEAGNFVFKNLPDGIYSIFAVKDVNNNYLCDGISEPIAFFDKAVSPTDTAQIKLQLFTPLEKLARFLKARLDDKNKVLLVFTSACKNFSYQLLDNKISAQNIATEISLNKDSVVLWVADTIADSLNIVMLNNGIVIDTAYVQLKNEIKQKQLGRGGSASKGASVYALINLNGNYFELGTKAQLTFNRPVKSFLKEQVVFLRDSIAQKDFIISGPDSLKRNFSFQYNFTENHKYTLLIPKETVTDFVGNHNDSLSYIFMTRKQRDYGSVVIKFETSYTQKHFIIQLVTEDDVPVKQFFTDASTTLSIENLLPAKYRFKLIDDSNHNNKWDSGDYSVKLQPEKVLYYNDIINVRSNWDVEVNWKLQ